ncbi:hypothetical protein BGZ76_002553, partial [Entomortierella beljakovae]
LFVYEQLAKITYSVEIHVVVLKTIPAREIELSICFEITYHRRTLSVPIPGERITTTIQLTYCLSLSRSSPISKEEIGKHKLQAETIDPDEQMRLQSMATDMIRAFIREDPKTHETVGEIVSLATVLDQDEFRKLLMTFVDGINKSYLLEVHLLNGLALLIRNSKQGYMDSDDLVKILELLNARLKDIHGQSEGHASPLVLAISNILDSMVDCQVKGLSHEQLHEPLSDYLKGLKRSSDPYFAYQVAYAHQALQYIPDDETILQSMMRRTGGVVRGISGMVSAVKQLDLAGFIEGLQNIQGGLAGAMETIELSKDAFSQATGLFESGQELLDSLKEINLTRKSAWYPALRGMDRLIQEGRFTEFEKLVRGAPCQDDPTFRWGVCQRLGEIAANPDWNINTRKFAVALLRELYQDDPKWRQQSQVNQWIMCILSQLTESPNNVLAGEAKVLLHDLDINFNLENQSGHLKLKQINIAFLSTNSPPKKSPLLAIVQNKPDVETPLLQLKRERLQAQGSDVYISPRAKSNFRATGDFDLRSKVQEFLDSDDKNVLLILGDSGAGKSTFNRALETSLWENYGKLDKRIPLFIYLPSVNRPDQDMIGSRLRNANFTESQILELKQYHEFTLICDGYDEIQDTQNLYMSNQLNQPEGWRAKMVISCRTEYIGIDYKDCFRPTDRNSGGNTDQLQEAIIKPFNKDQIEDYITQYELLHISTWGSEDYLRALNQIRNLQDLVKNPFLLRLTLEVLPHLFKTDSDFSSTSITRVQLYDEFVARWMERNKIRLREIELNARDIETFKSMESDFKQYGITYLKELTSAIYEHQNGNPVISYLQYRDRNTWKEALFNNEDGKHLLREVIPLTHDSDLYKFIHKSVCEYGLTLSVFDPSQGQGNLEITSTTSRRTSIDSLESIESRLSANSATNTSPEQLLLNSPLGKKNLVSAPSVLQFLAERVQQEPTFKDQLHSVIELSKSDKSSRIAAANAITILVRAGVSFNSVDLRNIQIPGADLSFGMFDSVQLERADLRKVNLRNVWMRQANLRGAQMKGVQFGELPFLQEVDEVHCCAYSPNGKLYATGLGNGNISVYETANWDKIYTLIGHSNTINSLSFSTTSDQIASGSDDSMVRLWDVETGECIQILEGHKEGISSLVYSPGGGRVASGSYDNSVRVWDVNTCECIHTLYGHKLGVNSIAFSPGGDRIASGGGGNYLINLWSVDTGECIHTFQGHTESVVSIAYSPKGDQITSGSGDRTVRVWDIDTGECIHILKDHQSYVSVVVYSPTGDRIASGSFDETVRVWNVDTSECIQTLRGHTKGVYSIVYSPSGDRIASGSSDNTVRVWDVDAGECIHTFQGHSNTVSCVLYEPSGYRIASGSSDMTVRVWDADTDECVHNFQNHSKVVLRVVCSPKGDRVASGSNDATVRVWDVNTGECIHIFQGHQHNISCVAFSPTGDQIASGGYEGTTRVWDVETGECVHTLQGHDFGVHSVAYSPKGNQIASGGEDDTVKLWKVDTGECNHILKGHKNGVRCVVYSPSGECIASGSSDGTVRLWEVGTGKCVHTLQGHDSKVHSVAYSPNGNQIASGGENNTVKLWDVDTGECTNTFQGHGYGFCYIVYSPRGDQIASRDTDNMVKLWDVDTGKCIYSFEGHSSPINSIIFSPKGDWVATGSDDKTLQLWDMETGRHIVTVSGFSDSINCIFAFESNLGAQYLLTGIGKSVRCWQIINGKDEYKAVLCWSSSHETLTVAGLSFEDVRDLSRMNQELLFQRGALIPKLLPLAQ